jgi:hypothetical protein
VSVWLWKLGTLGCQLGAQRREVLDDAVVNDGDAMTEMWMGVAFRRRPMGGPPGVADADLAGQRFFAELAIKIGELAFGPAAIEMPVMYGGDTGRIISAVFQPLERIHQQRSHLALANYPDYAAHAFLLGKVFAKLLPSNAGLDQ